MIKCGWNFSRHKYSVGLSGNATRKMMASPLPAGLALLRPGLHYVFCHPLSTLCLITLQNQLFLNTKHYRRVMQQLNNQLPRGNNGGNNGSGGKRDRAGSVAALVSPSKVVKLGLLIWTWKRFESIIC